MAQTLFIKALSRIEIALKYAFQGLSDGEAKMMVDFLHTRIAEYESKLGNESGK